MKDQIPSRKEHSLEIREKASAELKNKILKWSTLDEMSGKVCVYTTGSFGRGDASKHSDLDVFAVSMEEEMTHTRKLTGLEEIELLASIVSMNRELGLPEMDGDGAYLKVHSISDYLAGLGKPEDDANNTFTGRLLLMLESEPLFGDSVYNDLMQECVARYWVDFSGHEDSFLPAFLINDILRFWRTLCVNYEVGTSGDPAKRRAKNFKLKYSRLLTCFSAIVGLQCAYRDSSTISQQVALDVLRTPAIDRLLKARSILSQDGQRQIDTLVEMYADFLQKTDCPKAELISKMEEPDFYRASLEDARSFGDTMHRVLECAADQKDQKQWRFFRYLTV